MKLTQTLRIERPIDEVFAAVSDIERVVGCFPGARLLERIDTQTYTGELTARLGSLSLAYTGRLRVVEADRERRRLRVRARGTESSDSGDADAYLLIGLEPDGEATTVEVSCELTLRGTAARFGVGLVEQRVAASLRTFAAEVEQLLTRAGEATAEFATEPASPTQRRDRIARAATVVVAGFAAYAVVRALRRRRSQNQETVCRT